MDDFSFRLLWAFLALFALQANAQGCTSYGVDYTNGGAYNIDSSSNQYFSFITIFQGCAQEAISPVLVGPDGNQYACSVIRTTPAGQEVTSTCGIPFSAMRSGTWKIIVAGNQIATQRTFTVVLGVPQTTWVTATPTVVIGVTTTARAQTAYTTLLQTQTLIIVPATVTAACNGGTRTVTNAPPGQTTIVVSTGIRTVTDGQKTSFWTTTLSSTAICHYPSASNNPAPTGGSGGRPTGWPGFGGGRGPREMQVDSPYPGAEVVKREVAAGAAVAAVTSTYTQTTLTVTQTVVTTIPARTTTEMVLRTITQTVTPPPSTVCVGGRPAATVTVFRGTPAPVTQTSIVYLTSHLSGTVWVGQTQYTTISNQASATACWRAGGWFG